ncbi:hypothetical protein T10_4470 [Trichinella papuae]|uniref:Apple domain-containing protein n=1 Tax=Trichinella papuae TaxID=268474 RepID=A0A0V1MYQ0_9BILA|nr:hypothetical protein T10_4470 [Trichinella papuae]
MEVYLKKCQNIFLIWCQIRCLNLKSLATRLVKMQKYCFSASYLLCCTFCSLLQVSHSSEMQIYVPLIDKICLIQQIAIRQEILDSIDLFFINASFKSCISYSYSDFKLHNHSIFAYNEKTRSCSVVYDMPEENTIINCSEHDLQFYKVIHCMPAEGFMYTFEDEVEENVTRISTVKLKATAEICIVERHPFSENFLLKRSGRLFLQSLELCFAHCRVSLVRGNCSAVLFSSDERVCLLLQQNQPLQSTDVMRKSTSQFFTVNYCDYNITETTERRYYNGTGKITNIRIDDRQLQCTVHEIPLLRVHMKHRSLLWKSINFQNCIQFCGQQFQTNLCNAVYFEAEGTTCLHLLLNASQALYEYSENNKETVHFIEKCVEVTVRPELQQESAIYSSQSDEMRTSPLSGEGSSRTYNVSEQATDFFHYVAAENVQEQYVKLYEFLEVCKVQLLNIDVVRNAFTIQVSRKIYSLNRCLHICRRQTTCIAVLFSRLNHQCKKVFQGYSGMSIIVHAHEEVVALKECFKDRPDERKYNSEPLIYYFEETQQICAAEIYKRKNLTSWEVMMINKDISNFQLCLLNCIVNNQCSAINYFQTKECFLIKSAEKNYIFIVKDDSIFAEVLYCESGTLVDKFAARDYCINKYFLYKNFNASYSSIYVPKLDKVCFLEERNEYKMFTNSTIGFCVTSFSNCIAECWLWNDEDTFCIGFLYDFYNNHCFFYSRLFIGADDDISYTSFYLLRICIDVNLVEGFYEDGIIENVTRITRVFLPALNEICTIERLPFINNFAANRVHKVPLADMLSCFAHCRVLNWTSTCNAVLYSYEEGICLFLNYNDTNQESGIIRKSSAEFYSIKHCEFSRMPVVPNNDSVVQNHNSSFEFYIFSGRTPVECNIEKKLLKEKHLSYAKSLLSPIEFSHCLSICMNNYVMTNSCNAIYYDENGRSCLYFYLPLNNTSENDLENLGLHIFVIKSCGPATRMSYQQSASIYHFFSLSENHDEEVNSYSDESDSDISENELDNVLLQDSIVQTVKLHKFMEICFIQRRNMTYIENFSVFTINTPVWTLNMCLHHCRENMHGETRCSAVLFSRLNRKCKLLSQANYEDKYLIKSYEEFVSILSCAKDREMERIDNPAPINFYLEELRQICKVEFYVLRNLTQWKVLRKLNNVTTLNKCLLSCVMESKPILCSAINYSKFGDCILLRNGRNDEFFEVKDGTLFGEIIDCELGNYKAGLFITQNNGYSFFKLSTLISVASSTKNAILKNKRENNGSMENKIQRYIINCTQEQSKSCILFELGDEEDQYKVPSGSIVGEILHCEDGTLTLGSYRQIYVPSMDKFCLLKTLNINEAEVQHLLLYSFNSTLESCVANCFSYFILDICDFFSFNRKQRVCSRYRSLENRTFSNTESVDDNEFYTLVNCTEAANAMDTFINEETEIETDFNETKVIPLKFLREVCTIERLPFADSIRAKRITLVYPKTMEICLAQCRMSFSTITCNAFLYSLAEESCVLLHYNDVPQTQNEIRKSSSHFYKILNCDNGDDDSEAELAELTDIFISWASPQSSDSQSSSSESEELQQSKEDAVNSMIQNPEAPSTSSYANTKVEVVKLYTFYEICEIEKANFKTVQGVYDIGVNHRVYSLNKCLHLCRRATATIGCQAVLFLQQKYFCRLLVNGLPQNFVIVEDGEELVFMIACYNDRIEERLDNPPPMNYYLEEMKEICVVEAYKLQNLSAWAVIANKTNVSNFKECLSMCVKHNSPEKCTAINFSLKNYCVLIKRDASKSYTVMEKSIFVEILQCVPGLFSHQIYDI